MVVTILDDRLIQGGKDLLAKLDNANVFIDAALWFYFSELQSWKLLLSLPNVINQGPKAAYQTVQAALSGFSEGLPFSLEDILVSKPDSPLLNLMRIAINTGSGISSIRFSNNVINGQLIQDAYIYRLLRNSLAHSANPSINS